MSNNKPIRRIAIIGTGVIGASWTALFLAKGLEVVATDIAPDAETSLRRFVKAAWPALERLGLAPGASQSNVSRSRPICRQPLRGADFVQENGPERIDFKQKLYRQLDELLPADVIIASSSSGLTMSEIQSACRVAPRALRHRPSVQSAAPDPAGRDRRRREDLGSDHSSAPRNSTPALGKQTVRLNKEVPGHVANRLQAALAREVYYLVAEGVVSVADVDTALCWGPGPALGHHGQHDAQPSRRRPRRHRALLPAVHRPDDGLVEGSRLAGADARSAKEAHRQRSCRGRARARSTSWRHSATRSCSGLLELRLQLRKA